MVYIYANFNPVKVIYAKVFKITKKVSAQIVAYP